MFTDQSCSSFLESKVTAEEMTQKEKKHRGELSKRRTKWSLVIDWVFLH
jgi:hypothetical protein